MILTRKHEFECHTKARRDEGVSAETGAEIISRKGAKAQRSYSCGEAALLPLGEDWAAARDSNCLRHMAQHLRAFAPLRLCARFARYRHPRSIYFRNWLGSERNTSSCLRVSPENSPNHVDPAIQQRLGQAFVERFGGFFHAFQPVLHLARHQQCGGGVEQDRVAIGTLFAHQHPL